MKTLVLFFVLAASASAQNIVMKDGKVITTKGVRRSGDTIMATIDLPGAQSGQAVTTGQVGYPIAQISKIDFPEPPQLKAATDLITSGKAVEALAQIEPVLRYYEGFREAPGSWWTDASLLKLDALASLGRDDEAERMAAELARAATDPETVRAAKTYVAAGMARHGDQTKAMEVFDAVLKDATRPATIATASFNKGQIHLARKEWEPALLSFLEITVFYPQQKVLTPRVLLGCGRAYAAMEDFPRAKTSLATLTSNFASTPEASQAKVELDKIAKLEKLNEPPK